MAVKVLKRTTQLTGGEPEPEILLMPVRLPAALGDDEKGYETVVTPETRREPVKCYATPHPCECCNP